MTGIEIKKQLDNAICNVGENRINKLTFIKYIIDRLIELEDKIDNKVDKETLRTDLVAYGVIEPSAEDE